MYATESHTVRRAAQIAGFVTSCLLAIPFIGAQITDDWQWGVFDFALAGALIFGTAMVCSLLALRSDRLAYRAALAIAVSAGFLLLWANLAVGIVGEPDDRWNLLYYGVLAAAALVAVASQFRAAGMALAALTTGTGVAMVGTVVLLLDLGPPNASRAVVVAHALFVTAFVVSAALFRKAAADD